MSLQSLPKTIFLPLDKLEDYVHNKATPGDRLMCVSNEYGITREYIYLYQRQYW